MFQCFVVRCNDHLQGEGEAEAEICLINRSDGRSKVGELECDTFQWEDPIWLRRAGKKPLTLAPTVRSINHSYSPLSHIHPEGGDRRVYRNITA
jgi:hypothetical protein